MINVPELSIEIDVIKALIEGKTHYTLVADALAAFKTKFRYSERDVAYHLGISKSEVHRLMGISKLIPQLKAAAINYNVEKYVLVKVTELKENDPNRGELVFKILAGELKKYSDVREVRSVQLNRPKKKCCETCKKPLAA